MRRLVFILLFAAVPAWVSAQRMALASPRLVAPRPAPPANGPSGFGFAHPSRHHHGLYPQAFFWDPFFYDDSSEYPPATEPPAIILQAPPADNSARVQLPSPEQPLLIELRGGRYVRISGKDTSGAELIDLGSIPRRRHANSSTANPPVAVPELVPTILVFRDGHREQVSDYTIADGVLYAAANYYADGSWNRRIELSSLDLPETVKSNQSHGARFHLPTASNEVILGP